MNEQSGLSEFAGLEDELRRELAVVAREVRMPVDLARRLAVEVPASVRGGHHTGGRLGRSGRSSWLVPVLAGAAAVAVVLGGVDVVAQRTPPHRPAATNAVVPWNDANQVSVHEEAHPPALVGAPPGTPACTNRDFRLDWSQTVVGAGINGWNSTSYELESTSEDTCELSIYGIDATIVDASGQRLPDDAPFVSGPYVPPGDLRVRPGDTVRAAVSWAIVEGKAARAAAIEILPGDDSRSKPGSPLVIPVQDVVGSPDPSPASNQLPWRAGLETYGRAVVSAAGSIGSLAATLTAPSTVTPGDLLAATVRVDNHSRTAVSLSPCPEVVATITVVPLKESYTAGTRGPLNCAAAPHVVPAGGSVTFAVQVPTTGLPTGSGRIEWSLLVDGQPALTASASATALG